MSEKKCFSCQYWIDYTPWCLKKWKMMEANEGCEDWKLDPTLKTFLENMPQKVVVAYAMAFKQYKEDATK